MRAKFVSESFREESDPIKDMGIGIEAEIKNFFKEKYEEREIYSLPDFKNTEQVLNRGLRIDDFPEDFFDYLIERDSNYNKNNILRTCLYQPEDNDKRIRYCDKLIKLGAKLKNLGDLYYYIILEGTLLSLAPEQELAVASYVGDFKRFKKLIESGVKLKIGMFNGLLKTAWGYMGIIKNPEYDKILDWLRKQNLEDIVHPRDHKKLGTFEKSLKIKTKGEPKTYPHGYRIYRILKFINDENPSKRQDISKFIYELNYGKGTFDPVINGSYYSDAFNTSIYPNVEKGDDGKFYLNSHGQDRLKKYEQKFKGIEKTIDPYI